MNCALKLDHLLVEIERERKMRDAVAAIRRASFWDNTAQGEFLREIYGASVGARQHNLEMLLYGTSVRRIR